MLKNKYVEEIKFKWLKSFCNLIFLNKKVSMGFFLLLLVIFSSLFSNLYIKFDPKKIGLFKSSLPPNPQNIMGTDVLGRDVFAQIIVGLKYSLTLAVLVALIGTFTGAIMGLISGYSAGIISAILSGVVDIFLTIPMFPILILIASSVKILDITGMALVLSIFSWAWPARQVRGQVLSLKEREFIYLAKLSGMNSAKIMIIEVLPHLAQWMMAAFINSMLWAILMEVSLEILGLGVQYLPTLGNIIYWATYYGAIVRGIWWWYGFPIITMMITFMSLYLLHTGLDEIFNPKLKKI